MNSLEAYRLRLTLWERGYKAVPCYQDGRPALTLYSAPSESGIRSWSSLYETATLTGIVGPDGQITLVDSVPLSEAELEARRLAERRAGRRSYNRLQKARQRRSKGVQERSEWLAAHSIGRTKPWLAQGISERTWYRRRRDGKGVSVG